MIIGTRMIQGRSIKMMVLDEFFPGNKSKKVKLRMKNWASVFLRVNNRKKTHAAEDFIKAGYPMVDYRDGPWKELHDLCRTTFVDGKGRRTYIWFGNLFFFLTEEDAQLFRTLRYLL